MLIRLRRHATFSNVVAVLALFFALGGTVYAAGKLSGKTIKPNSLPGNRVTKNSLTGKQLKESAITGVASANGINHVTYQVATATMNPNSTTATTLTATCPTGQKAIGGGAKVGDPTNNGYINDVAPTADHSGWVADGFAGSGTTSDTLTVTAVCVPVTTTTP